ncbi:hypothetical protein [Chitinolyticbacter meiyuanensis]|uniref:hypothetical protein n=1 Tax=Chitinolyticbacter meiyuanensis TaxID=682798 RepID=UPI0011E5A4D4|nr:hypothetical protein [Chitinolyticbacter meiyuanensis]
MKRQRPCGHATTSLDCDECIAWAIRGLDKLEPRRKWIQQLEKEQPERAENIKALVLRYREART